MASQQDTGTKIALVACILLIFLSIIISQQKVSTVPETERIYDKQFVDALRTISKVVPDDEAIVAPGNIPQVSYFTDRDVIRTNVGFVTPVENFGRATIEFMWKSNSSYILIPEDASFAREDTPDPYPKTKVQSLDKILHKIGAYQTENSTIYLYHLPSNITADNVHIVTDYTWPRLSVAFPLNGTTIESRSNVTSVNVTGSAEDTDSKIKKVEVSMDSTFELANSTSSDDWSHWSYSLSLMSEGTKRIVVRATDNADHTTYRVVYVEIKNLK